MTTATAPPGLVAVMAPHGPRSRQMKILFRPAEYELLSRFAAAANTTPSYLARSLVFGGLNALLQQEGATTAGGDSCCSAEQAARCSEAPAIPKDDWGPLMNHNDPEPARAAGPQAQEGDPPMPSTTQEGGCCLAQLTAAAPVHATR